MRFEVEVMKKDYWGLVYAVFIIFLAFYLLYNGLKDKDLTVFAYSFFVGNSILCNALFALGRSTVFNETSKEREKKLIHTSAVMFLCSAMICLLLSGFAYIFTYKDSFGNTVWQGQSTKISLMGIYTFASFIAICLAGIGFFYFATWALIKLRRTYIHFFKEKKMNENEEK
jgi:hypothetical protein